MATQTSGPVWIPINLDFDEAERKLEAFKKKLPGNINQTVTTLHQRNEKQEKLWSQLKNYYQMTNVERWDFRQGQAANQKRLLDITHRPSPFSLQSWRETLNQGGLAAIGKRAMAAAAVPAQAALAYGIVSQTLKILPEAAGLGRQLGGEPLSQTRTGGSATVDQLQQLVEHMRTTIVSLEAKVTSIFTAFSKTSELNRASLRIGGKLADSAKYGKMFAESDSMTKQLNDKFEMWKGREAPFVMTQTFIDMMKRAVSR